MNTSRLSLLFLTFAIGLPLIISLTKVFNGTFPFWHDPARDLLLALDNIQKPSLIGPPSGIPGIFYGPYWIWLLSIPLLFSKDPRLVTFLIFFIPYIFLFPFLLFRFKKIFSFRTLLIGWLLFIFAYQQYTYHIWNPHLAPILFLGLVSVLFTANFEKKKYVKLFVCGILTGLIVNTHISFGIGIALGTFFYILVEQLLLQKKEKDRLKVSFFSAIAYILGTAITFSPFLLFEFRHGFNQIQAGVTALTNAALYNTAAVGQTGLSASQILENFFSQLAKLLQIPQVVSYALVLVGMELIIFRARQKNFSVDNNDVRLLHYLFLTSISALFIYFSSKNPVWEYHFVGVEILFLFLLMFFMKKFPFFEKLLIVWVIVLAVNQIILYSKSFSKEQMAISSLRTKQETVETIYQDVQKEPFAFYAYSPPAYDFQYIFTWLGKDKYNNFPSENKTEPKTIYLIITTDSAGKVRDFIETYAPKEQYERVKQFKTTDDTLVVKGVKISSPAAAPTNERR